MMKKLKTLSICTFMIISAVAFSQENNSVLWKISGNGLESPSYLFGTIHVMCPDQLKLSPKVEEALNESQQLVLELDMDEPTFMQEMQQLSVNSDMRNLSALLSEQELNTLNSFFKQNYQADMSQLGILKPLILMSMMFNKGLDCDQPGSYESLLMNYASQENWEVLGLESIKDQFDVFDTVSEDEQLEWLLKYARNQKKFKLDLAKLVEAYEQEDISEVLDFMTEYPEYKKIEDALLYDRNEKWIERVESIVNNKPTFFAVGTAHLPSERGVIELLRKEGYTLTPIMTTTAN
jgi:uncharacterized protein YbaP (TraB family)